jgi:hypothetical protein
VSARSTQHGISLIILKELASAQIDLPQLDSKFSCFLAAGEKRKYNCITPLFP